MFTTVASHAVATTRDGLTIGPRAFGGLALEYQNTALLVFRVSWLFTTRQNCRFVCLVRLVYRFMKLTTLAFIDF